MMSTGVISNELIRSLIFDTMTMQESVKEPAACIEPILPQYEEESDVKVEYTIATMRQPYHVA